MSGKVIFSVSIAEPAPLAQRGPLAVQPLLLDISDLLFSQPKPFRRGLPRLGDAHAGVLGLDQRREDLHTLLQREGLLPYVTDHETVLPGTPVSRKNVPSLPAGR